MPKKTEKESRNIGAYANATKMFLRDTIRMLCSSENTPYRVRLGAEHLFELRYALKSLHALLKVGGWRYSDEHDHKKKDPSELRAYASLAGDFLKATIQIIRSKEHAAIRKRFGSRRLLQFRYTQNSLKAVAEVLDQYEEEHEDEYEDDD